MILVLDNYDSFTLNLVDYLEQIGVKCQVVQNDISIDSLDSISFQGIILSPGPGTPSKSGILMETIEKYHQSKPILGICLGHQALGEYFGAKLLQGHKPMHGKISTIEHNGNSIFNGIPANFDVVRYHSLILEDLPNQIENIAFDISKGEIMGIRHKELPIWGVQFHPESILTEYGKQILENWVNLSNLNN